MLWHCRNTVVKCKSFSKGDNGETSNSGVSFLETRKSSKMMDINISWTSGVTVSNCDGTQLPRCSTLDLFHPSVFITCVNLPFLPVTSSLKAVVRWQTQHSNTFLITCFLTTCLFQGYLIKNERENNIFQWNLLWSNITSLWVLFIIHSLSMCVCVCFPGSVLALIIHEYSYCHQYEKVKIVFWIWDHAVSVRLYQQTYEWKNW